MPSLSSTSSSPLYVSELPNLCCKYTFTQIHMHVFTLERIGAWNCLPSHHLLFFPDRLPLKSIPLSVFSPPVDTAQEIVYQASPSASLQVWFRRPAACPRHHQAKMTLCCRSDLIRASTIDFISFFVFSTFLPSYVFTYCTEVAVVTSACPFQPFCSITLQQVKETSNNLGPTGP